jgi:hypothetical protein
MKLEKEISKKSFEKSKLVFSYFVYDNNEKFDEIDTTVITKGFNKNKYDENKYTLGIKINDEVDKILVEHEKTLPHPKGWTFKSYTDRNDTKYSIKTIFLNVGPNAKVNIPKEDYEHVTQHTNVKVKFAAGAYYDDSRKQFGVSLVVKELEFNLEQIKDAKDYFLQ